METQPCKREVGFHVKLKQSQNVSLKNVYIVENKIGPKQKGKIISHFPLFSETVGVVFFGNELALFHDKNNWHLPCT